MMRRFWPVAALLLAGCGTKPQPVAETKKSEPAPAPAPAPPAPVSYFHVDPKTAGTISGRITFSGTKPARIRINMESDAGCPGTGWNEPVITGKSGGLA